MLGDAVDGPVDDLDDAPPGEAPRGSRAEHQQRPGARRAVALVVVLVLVVVGASLGRQHQQRAATAQQEQEPVEQPVEGAPARRAVEAAALSALPDDLELTQRAVDEALAGAAPGLPQLAWSTAQTSTTRDGAQRTAEGGPVLVDAQRAAVPVADEDGGAGGGDRDDVVAWRITTPLRPQAPHDPSAAEGPVTVPDGDDGLPAPACVLKTSTSPSGEQQVVAVRSWERFTDPPGGARPARVRTVHLAVLVTNGRWTWSVASSAVGAPGSRASVPLLSLDQVALATRWTADAGRGLPTPAPLDGTPLPGFSG